MLIIAWKWNFSVPTKGKSQNNLGTFSSIDINEIESPSFCTGMVIEVNPEEQITTQQLPNISASATAGYLGDALVLDKNFSKVMTLDVPHFGNSFAVQASLLLFKGGLVKKSIEAATIKEKLAELDLVKDQQSIKFLVISNYLNVCRLAN